MTPSDKPEETKPCGCGVSCGRADATCEGYVIPSHFWACEPGSAFRNVHFCAIHRAEVDAEEAMIEAEDVG